MRNTESARRTLILAVMAKILVLLMFIGILGNEVKSYQSRLSYITEYAQEQAEGYLNRVLGSNHNLLQEAKRELDGKNFEEFSDKVLTQLSQRAFLGIIVSSDGRRYFNLPEYESLDIPLEELPADGSIISLFGERELPFGFQNRLFLEGIEIGDYKVFSGFFEIIMYGNFISTLDVEAVEEIKEGVSFTMNAIYALMFFVIGFGIALAYYAKKLRWICLKGEEGGVDV